MVMVVLPRLLRRETPWRPSSWATHRHPRLKIEVIKKKFLNISVPPPQHGIGFLPEKSSAFYRTPFVEYPKLYTGKFIVFVDLYTSIVLW